MAADALGQTRIDAEIKDRAAAVLEGMGLTVSDAVRILLTRVAHEGGLPVGLMTNGSGARSRRPWKTRGLRSHMTRLKPALRNAEPGRVANTRKAYSENRVVFVCRGGSDHDI